VTTNFFVELYRHSLVPVLTFARCRLFYLYLKEKLNDGFGGLTTDRHTINYFLVSPWFIAVPLDTQTQHTAHNNLKQVAVLTMEHLFSPCTRLNDLDENEDNVMEDFEDVKELNLDGSEIQLHD
jgi:hypothetical protein